MFFVGQKVQAVKHPQGYSYFVVPERRGEFKLNEPEVGPIYTVRALYVSPISGSEFVLLNEIRNDPSYLMEGYLEVGWPGDRFRPVVDRPTDISIFERLLNPSKQTEDA